MACLPLTSLETGMHGRVARIAAGHSATRRLYEMGFNTGADVSSENGSGSCNRGLRGHKWRWDAVSRKMLINTSSRSRCGSEVIDVQNHCLGGAPTAGNHFI